MSVNRRRALRDAAYFRWVLLGRSGQRAAVEFVLRDLVGAIDALRWEEFDRAVREIRQGVPA